MLSSLSCMRRLPGNSMMTSNNISTRSWSRLSLRSSEMPCQNTGRMGIVFQEMHFQESNLVRGLTSMAILLSRYLPGSVAILELRSDCRVTSHRSLQSTFSIAILKLRIPSLLETQKRLSLGNASFAAHPPWARVLKLVCPVVRRSRPKCVVLQPNWEQVVGKSTDSGAFTRKL